MTKKNQLEKQCLTKQRYGTSRQVEQAAERVEKRHGTPMDWYPCLHCGGFHLTTKRG